jgi:hypothetical protein
MKRNLFNTLVGLNLTAMSINALADQWKFMPVMDTSYKANPTVSLVGGVLNGTPSGSGNYKGAEVALNCLLLQPPTGIIRTKLSYGQFDHNGLKLSTFEVNPRWTTDIAQDLTIGVGPGIGYVKADVAGKTTSMAALQIGADLDYHIGQLNLGLGARWQDTRNKDISLSNGGANNTLVQENIGYNF